MLPATAQALIFIAVVKVDSTLLLSMVAASVVGGWLGAGVVSRLSRRRFNEAWASRVRLAARLPSARSLVDPALFVVLVAAGFPLSNACRRPEGSAGQW